MSTPIFGCSDNVETQPPHSAEAALASAQVQAVVPPPLGDHADSVSPDSKRAAYQKKHEEVVAISEDSDSQDPALGQGASSTREMPQQALADGGHPLPEKPTAGAPTKHHLR